MQACLDSILAFLAEIGIVTREASTPAGSFLPGIRISRGTLLFDRSALRWPGDLLHEAGHIATAPAALRASLDDALESSDSVPHAGEVEATAWAYAAVVQLQLDPAVLFHDGGYRGQSQGLIRTYGLGVYPGAFGLAQAGMTHVGPEAQGAGLPVYPRMSRWLRE
jgi:hypothetical protein